MTIKCNECGKEISPVETNGLPNGVGFELEDGTIWNVCAECLVKISETLERVGKNDKG